MSTAEPPKTLKYQSQMLMLNSGYYQDWNDNIILALCELPAWEAVGPILIVDFAK